MLVLVSLGLACIVIGVILGVLQITSGAQHDANSLVHAVILMGSYCFAPHETTGSAKQRDQRGS